MLDAFRQLVLFGRWKMSNDQQRPSNSDSTTRPTENTRADSNDNGPADGKSATTNTLAREDTAASLTTARSDSKQLPNASSLELASPTQTNDSLSSLEPLPHSFATMRLCSFPIKLYEIVHYTTSFSSKVRDVDSNRKMNQKVDYSMILSWHPYSSISPAVDCGYNISFVIWDKDAFMKHLAPRFFPTQNVFRSLERTLNAWNFTRNQNEEIKLFETWGEQRGLTLKNMRVYSNKDFQKHVPAAVRTIQRRGKEETFFVSLPNTQMTTQILPKLPSPTGVGSPSRAESAAMPSGSGLPIVHKVRGHHQSGPSNRNSFVPLLPKAPSPLEVPMTNLGFSPLLPSGSGHTGIAANTAPILVELPSSHPQSFTTVPQQWIHPQNLTYAQTTAVRRPTSSTSMVNRNSIMTVKNVDKGSNQTIEPRSKLLRHVPPTFPHPPPAKRSRVTTIPGSATVASIESLPWMRSIGCVVEENLGKIRTEPNHSRSINVAPPQLYSRSRCDSQSVDAFNNDDIEATGMVMVGQTLSLVTTSQSQFDDADEEEETQVHVSRLEEKTTYSNNEIEEDDDDDELVF